MNSCFLNVSLGPSGILRGLRVLGPTRLRPCLPKEHCPGPGLAGTRRRSTSWASPPPPCSLAVLELSRSLAPRGAWDSSLTPGLSTPWEGRVCAPCHPARSLPFVGPLVSPDVERDQSRCSQVSEACRAAEEQVRWTVEWGERATAAPLELARVLRQVSKWRTVNEAQWPPCRLLAWETTSRRDVGQMRSTFGHCDDAVFLFCYVFVIF